MLSRKGRSTCFILLQRALPMSQDTAQAAPESGLHSTAHELTPQVLSRPVMVFGGLRTALSKITRLQGGGEQPADPRPRAGEGRLPPLPSSGPVALHSRRSSHRQPCSNISATEGGNLCYSSAMACSPFPKTTSLT